MKYKVKKTSGSILRRMVGSYIDSLPRLHKFAPCIIEQQTDIEDEEHNSTTLIRIDPPKGKRPIKFRLRLFYVILALLLASCAETPADKGKTLSIQDLESGLDLTDTTTPEVLSTSECFDIEAEWEAVSKLAHTFAIGEEALCPKNNPK